MYLHYSDKWVKVLWVARLYAFSSGVLFKYIIYTQVYYTVISIYNSHYLCGLLITYYYTEYNCSTCNEWIFLHQMCVSLLIYTINDLHRLLKLYLYIHYDQWFRHILYFYVQTCMYLLILTLSVQVTFERIRTWEFDHGIRMIHFVFYHYPGWNLHLFCSA